MHRRDSRFDCSFVAEFCCRSALKRCHAGSSTSIPTLMEHGLKSNSIENLIPEYKAALRTKTANRGCMCVCVACRPFPQ
ncbi:hypothetical protein VTH06DRAFT_1181 [Thermothelomyces fergusii]